MEAKVGAIIIASGCGVIVLMVLAAMLVQAYGKAQESARRAGCISNACNIMLAMIQYSGDWKEEFPAPLAGGGGAQNEFARLLKGNYLNAAKIFHCPSAKYTAAPTGHRLTTTTLMEAALEGEGGIAPMYLATDWCSYGVDPKVKHSDKGSRAVIADRPDPAYWGPTTSGPGLGDRKGNSANHNHAGQNVIYNDGHSKWSSTCSDDDGFDPNIYGANPEIVGKVVSDINNVQVQLSEKDDSNIRYGSGPNKP